MHSIDFDLRFFKIDLAGAVMFFFFPSGNKISGKYIIRKLFLGFSFWFVPLGYAKRLMV